MIPVGKQKRLTRRGKPFTVILLHSTTSPPSLREVEMMMSMMVY